jgi:CheY-like chemotaxis protein
VRRARDKSDDRGRHAVSSPLDTGGPDRAIAELASKQGSASGSSPDGARNAAPETPGFHERRVLPRPLRVLVVDDSRDIRELWRDWLHYWGFLVDEAQDGRTAVQRATAARPDLVLMDLWMPILDGFAATEQLKANPSTSAVPILALSADSLMPTRDRAMKAGCEAFLPKPIASDDLLEEIRRALSRVRDRMITQEGSST